MLDAVEALERAVGELLRRQKRSQMQIIQIEKSVSSGNGFRAVIEPLPYTQHPAPKEIRWRHEPTVRDLREATMIVVQAASDAGMRVAHHSAFVTECMRLSYRMTSPN